jgi:hypothetical protein
MQIAFYRLRCMGIGRLVAYIPGDWQRKLKRLMRERPIHEPAR